MQSRHAHGPHTSAGLAALRRTRASLHLSMGQAPAPDLHWGSDRYPQSKSELRAGLSFNRCTQSNGGASAAFSEIEGTAGTNFRNLAYATRIPAYPEGSASFSTGVGITEDQRG